MRMTITLVVVGVVLFMIGLAMLRSSRRAGLDMKNSAFNIGSTSTQSITASGAGGDKKANPNWVGLAMAVIGLLTAVIGLFKVLR